MNGLFSFGDIDRTQPVEAQQAQYGQNLADLRQRQLAHQAQQQAQWNSPDAQRQRLIGVLQNPYSDIWKGIPNNAFGGAVRKLIPLMNWKPTQ